MGVLSKFEESKIKDTDRSVKNKFSFKWLERTVDIKLAGEAIKVYLGDDFMKCDLPGQALCNLCSKQINYGSRGAVALEDHVRSSKHISLLRQKRSNYKIESFIKQHSDEPEKVKVDLAASGSDPSTSATSKSEPQLVSMCDRISNAEVGCFVFYLSLFSCLLGMKKWVLCCSVHDCKYPTPFFISVLPNSIY